MSEGNRGGDGAAQDKGRIQELRQRAIDAYDSARDGTSGATRRAGEAIGGAPMVALGAGLAVGAIVAALIPTSRRERELLGPYADRATDAARDAVETARKAGSDKLRELGLTPDALSEKAGEAARSTAQAVVGSLRGESGKA